MVKIKRFWILQSQVFILLTIIDWNNLLIYYYWLKIFSNI